jgi:hypothetical protein
MASLSINFSSSFWDIHELIDTHPPAQMTPLHAQRYQYAQAEDLIRTNFTDFSRRPSLRPDLPEEKILGIYQA